MPLNYDQAKTFAAAGFDIRRDDMPAGDFVRWHDEGVTPAAPAGYTVSPFVPTFQQSNSNDFRWRFV